MRLSLAKQKAPVIIGVVREKTPKAAIAAIRNCEIYGATGIDLHISCLDVQYQTVESMRSIIASSKLPVMALNYNQRYDRSNIGADENTRLGLLLKAAEAGAAAIDMQGYSFDPDSQHRFNPLFRDANYSFIKNEPKEIVVDPLIIDKQKEFIDRVHAIGSEVLMSNHTGIPMDSDQIIDYANFLLERNVDMIKIVTVANNDMELAESFKTMIRLKKEIPIPVSYHCSGTAGRLSRIINPMLGGFLVFCVDGYNEFSDFNQLYISTARTLFDNVSKI
jgi:hypothetical protein